MAMRFAFSSKTKCLVTACRVMSRCSHNSLNVCPFSLRNSSSNFLRLAVASALKTASISDIMQLNGCMSIGRISHPLRHELDSSRAVAVCRDMVERGEDPLVEGNLVKRTLESRNGSAV